MNFFQKCVAKNHNGCDCFQAASTKSSVKTVNRLIAIDFLIQYELELKYFRKNY